jgi:branched-subunit amino acid transport protein
VNVVLAVLVVGAGSLAYRMIPLLTGRQIPPTLARGAGWAGMAVIAGITVRSVVLHEDGSTPLAPLVAAVSVTAGLVLAYRGRGVLVAVGVGCSSYVVLAAVLAGIA